MGKRKANGEGSVTKLPSGSYRLRTVDEIDGVTVRKSFTASSPTACRKAHKEWLASDNKVAIERVKTVGEWAAHWLEVYCKPNVTYSTYKDYKMYVDKHIVPAIGVIRLTDVRPAHIAKLYANSKNRYGKELSRSAKGNIMICLNGIFDTAIDNSLCHKNPAANIELPEKAPQRINAFSRTQIAHIVDFLDKHEYGAYIAFLLYTGLRIGEFLSLMWSDVDSETKTLHIHRTITKGEQGEIVKDLTKTKRDRVVTFDEALEKYLSALPRSGLYIVCRDDGSHHTHRTYERLYKLFFEDLNTYLAEEGADAVPYMSPHKCRHTFATYMLRSGADIRAIQTLLGHATLKTTEIYTEVDVDDLKNNVKKLSFK